MVHGDDRWRVPYPESHLGVHKSARAGNGLRVKPCGQPGADLAVSFSL